MRSTRPQTFRLMGALQITFYVAPPLLHRQGEALRDDIDIKLLRHFRQRAACSAAGASTAPVCWYGYGST
ncbi:MAG: hypothetical protein NZ699_04535 [Roseiflexus sp.]|nr:hypothetical protein [Roseiflexus sp.]MCS7288380.1 hypothetical protein [Roseiflexus sp.]MDW8146530.1 hypothetical protein [Roseiflexaceae bacterium]MDW8231191.1 hypothetical protein [Roseiflexaceae bacterium]